MNTSTLPKVTYSLDNFIDNYIYFYHLGEAGEYMIIPTYPETISDSMGSNFSSQNALSRSAPIFSYTNSGPRSVQIDLKLHRDMLDNANIINSSITKSLEDLIKGNDYIDILIKKLQAIALPKYSAASKAVEPPMIAIRFGNELFIKGVVTSAIGVTYNKPILSNNKYALVDISFNVSEVDPYDADTVAAEGSFRGITRSFKNGVRE